MVGGLWSSKEGSGGHGKLAVSNFLLTRILFLAIRGENSLESQQRENQTTSIILAE
jgi:hypothetical protein